VAEQNPLDGRAVIVAVDTSSAVPPYEQIRAQVVELVETGALQTGARLPTIRQLAGDLGLAPGTVARAYRELESAGVVVSRVRHGTTVARRPRPTARQTDERLTAAAQAYAATVHGLGLDRAQAVQALDRQLAALEHAAGRIAP
jgi:DNA-binding transcriptional regulator YhcF (GntR family)